MDEDAIQKLAIGAYRWLMAALFYQWGLNLEAQKSINKQDGEEVNQLIGDSWYPRHHDYIYIYTVYTMSWVIVCKDMHYRYDIEVVELLSVDGTRMP